MKEEKLKKIVIGATAAAVILLVFLLIFWIYQMVAVTARNNRIKELEEEIAYYEYLIENSEDDLLVYQSRLWLEQRAFELGLLYKGK